MNKNLLMLCYKATLQGDTMVSDKGHVFSTWEFAHARSFQVKQAIDNIPDNPMAALIKYFRAKDVLLSDFSVLSDLFEETKDFSVKYDELKDAFSIVHADGKEMLRVDGSSNGFKFYKNDMLVHEIEYTPDIDLERMVDIVFPFFVKFE